MHKFWAMGAACLGLAGLVGCVGTQNVTSPAAAQAVNAPVPSRPPIVPAYHGPVIELAGSPQQIGHEHGELLRGPIQLLHDRYLKVYLGDGAHRFLALGLN